MSQDLTREERARAAIAKSRQRKRALKDKTKRLETDAQQAARKAREAQEAEEAARAEAIAERERASASGRHAAMTQDQLRQEEEARQRAEATARANAEEAEAARKQAQAEAEKREAARQEAARERQAREQAEAQAKKATGRIMVKTTHSDRLIPLSATKTVERELTFKEKLFYGTAALAGVAMIVYGVINLAKAIL